MTGGTYLREPDMKHGKSIGILPFRQNVAAININYILNDKLT